MRNKEDKLFDELLKNAFTEQYKKETKNGPTDEDLSAMHPFTEEHMKKAEALRRKNKKDRSLWKKGLGKVAAIILCVATAGSVITLSNPDIRGRVSKAVARWIDEYIAVDFSDASGENEIDIAKTHINYIPEGFSLIEDNSDNETVSHIYENEKGDVIIIDIEISSDIKLMTENNAREFEYHSVNGYEGYVSYSEEMMQGSVYFGTSYFTVAISGMSEKDELIKIAENIVFKD